MPHQIKKCYTKKKDLHQAFRILHQLIKIVHQARKTLHPNISNFTPNRKNFRPNFIFLLLFFRLNQRNFTKIRNILHQTDSTFGLS